MPEPEAADPHAARPTVFLSYASEDREAARVLRDALPGYGLEVWYDESELGGGEAWDQKIRRQIRECDYFMPVVSAQTERRTEGYFRREWRLAVERTLDMADDRPFLLPVAIDDTEQFRARVPEKFLAVQWLRVPGGRPTPAFEATCRRIAAGSGAAAGAATPSGAATAGATAAGAAIPFPVAHDGQQVRFWFDVAGWSVRSAWAAFSRLPRWVRILAYLWIGIALLSRCGDSSPRHVTVTPSPTSLSSTDLAKLKSISGHYAAAQDRAGEDKKELVKLGADIAKEFADDTDEEAAAGKGSGAAGPSPLLAVAFTAPPGDAAAARFADSAFAMAYGRAAISHRGRVGLTTQAITSRDPAAALERGRTEHATYVLFGDVEGAGAAQTLHVRIARVADGSDVWAKSYSVRADPATIAAEVETHIPSLDAG